MLRVVARLRHAPRALRGARCASGQAVPSGLAPEAYAELLAARRSDPLVVRSVPDMRAVRAGMDLLAHARSGRAARVGFVPTMGALHAGHTGLLDLARAGGPPGSGSGFSAAARAADFVVSSIYVNPTQFAPHEDLSRYPRTWEADVAKLRAKGCDVVFAPTPAAMYPPSPAYRTFVGLNGVDEGTPEGAARPGFFRGVATVVTKLLCAVSPTEAWFGQKDGIQCVVVRTLVRDLNLGPRIRIGATAREADGLAMSSRNVYLSPAQRAAAPVIYAALTEARRMFEASPEGKELLARVAERQRAAAAPVDEREAELAAQRASFGGAGAGAAAAAAAPAPGVAADPLLRAIEQRVRAMIAGETAFSEVQYCTFSDALTGAPLARLADSSARNGAVMLSVAAKTGATRLLDNVMLIGSHEDLGAAPWEPAPPS